MKTDIIILSKTEALVSTALASICNYVDKKAVGKVMRGRADTLQTRYAEEEKYFKDHNCNDIDLSDALKDILYKESK